MVDVFPPEDRRTSLQTKASNVPYVVAVMFMMMLGVVAIVLIVIMRPGDKDNINSITVILGFLAPTTLSLLAFMKSQETHLSVNSRLDAFMSTAKMAAHSQGVSEGRIEGRALANERTDQLAAAAAIAVPVSVVSDPLNNIEKHTRDAVDVLKEIKEK